MCGTSGEAAILRASPLGDVHPGDRLDRIDNRFALFVRDFLDISQRPVDSVADAKRRIIHWMDQDIAGFLRHRPADNLMSQTQAGRRLFRFANTCDGNRLAIGCLLYTSPSPRDLSTSRMPSSA